MEIRISLPAGPSAKARRVLAALVRIGWQVKLASRLPQDAVPARLADYVFAFHDNDEIGPRMLARIAWHTGLKPGDL